MQREEQDSGRLLIKIFCWVTGLEQGLQAVKLSGDSPGELVRMLIPTAYDLVGGGWARHLEFYMSTADGSDVEDPHKQC